MSNGQFNYSTPLTRRTLARAEAVNAIFQAIAAGFDLGYSAAQIDALLTALEAEILADYTAAINAAITGGPGAAFASQAQAEAGADNTTLMSPLRVSQAITALTASAFAAKLALAGGTMTGKLNTLATALAGAGLNLPHGTAPTSPTNGDIWTTTAGLYGRINGSTVGPFGQAKNMTLLASSAASGSAVAFTSIDQNYSTLILVGDQLSHNNGSSQNVTFEISVNNGSGYTSIGVTIVAIANASATASPIIMVPCYAQTVASNPIPIFYSTGASAALNAVPNVPGNRINAVRLVPGAASWDAGNVYLYGMP